MSQAIYAKPGPKTVPVNTVSLKAVMHLRGFTQQAMADRLNVSLGTVQNWLWGNKDPTEANFDRLCEALRVTPVQLTAHSKELRDRARHERVMKYYHAEMLDELPIADYREIQLIEGDIDRTAEFDPGADDTREAEVTVSSAGEPSDDAEPDNSEGD